jgi:hypothetical protein
MRCRVSGGLQNDITNPKQFAMMLFKWLIAPLISLCFSIYFKSSRLFCSGQFEVDPGDRSLSSNRAADAFALAFLLPMALCITADIIYYAIIQRRLSLMNSLERLHTNTFNTKLQPSRVEPPDVAVAPPTTEFCMKQGRFRMQSV